MHALYGQIAPILDDLRQTLLPFAHPAESIPSTLYTFLPLPDTEMPFYEKKTRHLWWNTLFSPDEYDLAPGVTNSAIPAYDPELDMLVHGTTDDLLKTFLHTGPYVRYLNNRTLLSAKDPEILATARERIAQCPAWDKDLQLRWNHPLALVLLIKR